MRKTKTNQNAKAISNKQQAFIMAYCGNGNNAKQACITAGYSERTAAEQGSRLLTKVHVKRAIADHMASLAAETTRTVQSLDQMLQAAYELGKETKQSSSMVSACTALARLYGMDQPALAAQPLQITVNQEPAPEPAAVPVPAIKLTNIA